jgi:DNA polymerase-3 subunit gamma/tau
MPAESPPYRVLARKYRPQTFAALIGQDAMVTTLANAIKRDRLAHAFLLTGVRGIGKTSTARLIAKALNCIGPDGQGGPTIDPCGICEPCVAIAEGRHIDVIEMDAASHTGIDDVREIIEAVRYAAVSARYKVYIIDEVHMLSKQAFNGLLKTLEEPPPHVKFIFATTEVGKVPVTVLSRCQRFDLKRVPADLLAAHFARLAVAEEVPAEPEALALIARAADGSVRDGLSILDQAIAHAGIEEGGVVRAVQVRDMLGLGDRATVRELFALLLAGDGPAVLDLVGRQHAQGIEPVALFRGLLETVHGITRRKVGGAVDPAQSVEEREDWADWASRMSHATLHRLWQLLMKGIEEVAVAPMPREAAEMALLRIVHASSLPDPDALARKFMSGEPIPTVTTSPVPPPAPSDQPPLLTLPEDFPALVALLEGKGEVLLAEDMRTRFGLVRYAPPTLVLKPLKPGGGDFARRAGLCLKAATGATWSIEMQELGAADASLREQEDAAIEAERARRLADPAVRAVLDVFPDATLIEPMQRSRLI